MNRPTKYRVWHNGQMLMVQTLCFSSSGILWYGPPGTFGYAWVNPHFDGWNDQNMKPGPGDIVPMMQWTGLVDKEGKEIWEGDVVFTYGVGPAMYVKWLDDIAGYTLRRLDNPHVRYDMYLLDDLLPLESWEAKTNARMRSHCINPQHIVVIGNRWENAGLVS